MKQDKGAIKISMGGTLTWRHNPERNEEWQLHSDDKVVARISIPMKSPDASGNFFGKEFVIEFVNPYRIKWKRSSNKEPKERHIIKLRNLNDELPNATMEEWGHLEFGFGRCFNPARLVVHDDGTYSISCNQISNGDYSREFVISSSDPKDDDRTLGVTRQAKSRDGYCTFNTLYYQHGNPQIILMAAICFYMLIRVCLEENNFGFLDWSPFSGN